MEYQVRKARTMHMFEAALILNDFTMVLALEKCLFVSFLNSKCLEWCPYRCPEADKM